MNAHLWKKSDGLTFFGDGVAGAGQLEDGLFVVNVEDLGHTPQDELATVEVVFLQEKLEGEVAPAGLLGRAGREIFGKGHLQRTE